jgi:hypothetical protein
MKDERLMVAIANLRSRFGDAIDVVDHWHTNPLAVGTWQRGKPEPSVYVTAVPDHDGRFDLALELPPQPRSELPYEDGGWCRGLGLAEMVDAVALHLGLS